ncbi:MAG: cupin domain-containing protein [Actinomycetota bacterium]
MGLVDLDRDQDNLVTAEYSAGLGPVLRSEHTELVKARFLEGTGAELHSHPEEQIVYCVQGRLEAVVGEGEEAERFVIEPGEACFNPSNVPHGVQALEDSVVLSFKIRASEQIYRATGSLG